jgi:hypothetical protein
MTDESWIQDSVARLDELERLREQLAAQGREAELTEVDEEIEALYEVLESAAEQAESASPAPEPVAEVASPFAAPPPAFELAPGVPEPIAATPSQSFSVNHVRRSRAPMMAAALVVVVGGGIGGWWLNQQNHAKADAPAAVGEPQVIQAGEIPDDTQEPDAARGGDAERTQGIRIRESDGEARRRTSKSPARSRSQAKTSASASPGRTIQIDDSRDPLAGVK